VTTKEPFPKVYLYRRIVYAKLFIDEHFAENIDLNNIAGEAFFPQVSFYKALELRTTRATGFHWRKAAIASCPGGYLNAVRN
jgi:hypothetical protein